MTKTKAKERVEEKPYMTPDEAARFIGVKRATLYHYMKKLEIKAAPMRIADGRKRFLSLADVKRMKDYKESPQPIEPDPTS